MEDRVSPDPAPDDVRMTRMNLVSILEGGTAVVSPRHLPHAGMALDPLDAKARMEALAATREVGDELRDGLAEGSLLLRI